GFMRSLELGDRCPPLSIVLDRLGIYYDASVPSALEDMIASACSPAEQERASLLVRRWCEGRLSKYNHAREAPQASGPFVLAVDQTFGDASIHYGLADAASFAPMLQAALDEHPQCRVLLKVHPDVIAGRKRGHFDRLSAGAASRITVLASDAHPSGLLERASAVYCVTSQMGFEALLWGKPVRCFGMPFYAGWGLTRDALPAPSRRQPVPLEQLVHAALVRYARYLDPETGRRCEVERLMEHLALQRRMRERFAPQVYAVGFSRWKKPIVRAYFGGSAVHFVRSCESAPPGATLAVWGRRDAGGAAQRVVRLEDGFLRSVGLGADLIAPLSWVMDGSGVYYDAGAPSDLERLLGEREFEPALLERARALRQRITALGLTKYNVGAGSWQRPDSRKRTILVPGQVESDAAMRYATPGVRGNFELLQAVRAAAPGAHIVYKPHPDVVARLRAAGRGEDRSAELCDEIVIDTPMDTLLRSVDEVHVLTSLAGFEALLRGRKVVTYGCPFYAGWGLTDDQVPMPRRQRRLTLDELVAGVLILYPTYISRSSGQFTTPERALTELAQWREAGGGAPSPWQRAWRRFRRLLLGSWSQLRTR
ncbi:MAG: capsular polysaccharide biosynthesis protein, partial [Burkholderiaceae bacterium]